MSSDQKNAVIAVVLSGIVLFAWQFFFSPPKDASLKKDVVSTTVNPTNTNTKEEISPKTEPESVAKIENQEEQLFHFNGKELSFDITNKLQIQNINSKNAVFQFKDLFDPKPLSLSFKRNDDTSFRYLNVSVKENSLGKLVLEDSTLGIVVTFSENEHSQLAFEFISEQPFFLRTSFVATEKKLDNNQKRSFIYFQKNAEIISPDSSETVDGGISWLGVDFNYHLLALSFQEKIIGSIAAANGTMAFSTKEAVKRFDGTVVYTKKNYDSLSDLGNNLDKSVDFGLLGIIAVPILRGLQFFYKYIPNYGIGIILLTILMRLITFPLQFKSYASMKKMQKIQPEIAKIKEKYKEDPQRIQKETMELFKKAGANPLGGCLPLLLQMPIFFAFYRVLYAAVELVDAPFYFWIHDLSVRDPYFILPVLMTLSMFGQQKLTPNTATDPAQQKIIMFMPLIFGFIMKDLPSGLVLYIFVSTIFGIVQQLLVYRALDAKKQ